jgi:gas vesicle protein
MNSQSKIPKKKKSKLLAGLIIGGAIGSVLGLAFAPKKFKEKAKRLIKHK